MDMQNITKIALAWELFGQQTAKIHIAEHIGVNRRTIHRWITGIKKLGDLESFLDVYLVAKKGERKKRK